MDARREQRYRLSGVADGVGGLLKRAKHRPLVALLILLALVSLFFVAFPGIDKAFSAYFYRAGLGFRSTDDLDMKLVRQSGTWMTIAAIGASGPTNAR